MEHGFVKTLYKRCRTSFKKLDDCKTIEAKQKHGGKCTDTQLEKLKKKDQYQAELNADLETLDLFLKHHKEPQAPPQDPVEEVKAPAEEAEPVQEVPAIESKFSLVRDDHVSEELREEVLIQEEEPAAAEPKADLRDALLLLCNLVKVAEMNTFTDIPQDSIVKCVMFYKAISMRSREEMCDEVLKVVERCEEAAMPQGATYADMFEILHKISQAQMNAQ